MLKLVSSGLPHWSVLVDWTSVIAQADSAELLAIGKRHLVPDREHCDIDEDLWAKRTLALWTAFQCGVAPDDIHVIFLYGDTTILLATDPNCGPGGILAVERFTGDVILLGNAMRSRATSFQPKTFRFRWENGHELIPEEQIVAREALRNIAVLLRGDGKAYEPLAQPEDRRDELAGYRIPW